MQVINICLRTSLCDINWKSFVAFLAHLIHQMCYCCQKLEICWFLGLNVQNRPQCMALSQSESCTLRQNWPQCTESASMYGIGLNVQYIEAEIIYFLMWCVWANQRAVHWGQFRTLRPILYIEADSVHWGWISVHWGRFRTLRLNFCTLRPILYIEAEFLYIEANSVHWGRTYLYIEAEFLYIEAESESCTLRLCTNLRPCADLRPMRRFETACKIEADCTLRPRAKLR